MITSRIVGVITAFPPVAAFFFAIDQTLKMFLKSSPSIRQECIQYFAYPIDGSQLLIGQVEFFAIRMLRIVVPCHLAPFFLVRTDFRLRMSATAP